LVGNFNTTRCTSSTLNYVNIMFTLKFLGNNFMTLKARSKGNIFLHMFTLKTKWRILRSGIKDVMFVGNNFMTLKARSKGNIFLLFSCFVAFPALLRYNYALAK